MIIANADIIVANSVADYNLTLVSRTKSPVILWH
uniref:Uncharacterized protein n=1 Tax=Rhizophora mucronata TaxID=61149 RepID=A0A2P2NV22_RHIMU